jgi:hypothetical protein
MASGKFSWRSRLELGSDLGIDDEKKRPAPLSLQRCNSSDSDSSSESTLKPPRTPRFAEATTVYSPIEPKKNPFADPKIKTTQFTVPLKPSDVGFGYISDNRHSEVPPMPASPASPLKSAMKVPGTPGRGATNPLSPTFREEQLLDRHEVWTEKEQAKDMVGRGWQSPERFVLTSNRSKIRRE